MKIYSSGRSDENSAVSFKVTEEVQKAYADQKWSRSVVLGENSMIILHMCLLLGAYIIINIQGTIPLVASVLNSLCCDTGIPCHANTTRHSIQTQG